MIDQHKLRAERVRNAQKDRSQLLRLGFVEPRARFIHQNHLRLSDQRLGDLHHATFEKIECPSQPVQPARQPNERKGSVYFRPAGFVVVDDMIGIRSMMNLSLTIDHRALDGLAATRFLAAVRDRLEGFQGGES